MAERASDLDLSIAALAKKTYLRPEQRQELELSTRQLREELDNPALAAEIDIEAKEKQYDREMELLTHGTPPRYDSSGMNKIRRLEQHLREQITHALPTYSMMERATPNNIDFHIAWERDQQQNVLAWKTCLQILDPGNTEPNFLSIARLRSDTVKGDPRQYARNFDNIKWEEVVEEDLIRDMDDQVYMQFLELRLLEWSKPSICHKLNWSSKIYEAAMQRLRESKSVELPEPAWEDEDDVSVDRPHASPGETVHGWPRDEMDELGISLADMCKAIRLSETTLRKYATTGNWPLNFRRAAEAVLRKAREAVQPSEPFAGLKEALTLRGPITQQVRVLAHLMHVTTATVYNYINGKPCPALQRTVLEQYLADNQPIEPDTVSEPVDSDEAEPVATASEPALD